MRLQGANISRLIALIAPWDTRSHGQLRPRTGSETENRKEGAQKELRRMEPLSWIISLVFSRVRKILGLWATPQAAWCGISSHGRRTALKGKAFTCQSLVPLHPLSRNSQPITATWSHCARIQAIWWREVSFIQETWSRRSCVQETSLHRTRLLTC